MKSFQEILEKRVRNTKNFKCDFYTIEKATKEVLIEMFGKAGILNVKIKDWQEPTLVALSEKSLWRSELLINKNKFMKKINQRIGKEVVNNLRVL